jgi:hypothetical protein
MTRTEPKSPVWFVLVATAIIVLAVYFCSLSAGGPLGVVIVLVSILGLALYMIPTIIAICRDHHQCGAIAIVNFFFGWTFIGWVVALAWSASHVVRERA